MGFREQLSTTSFEAFEPEISMNYSVHNCTHTWTGIPASREISRVKWCIFGLSSGLNIRFSTFLMLRRYLYSFECSVGCLVDGHLYPCLFCTCWCFQVSNSCREIHSAAFMSNTALTYRDFWSALQLTVKFSWFYLIFTDI